jgi:hypothetical protein
MELKTVIGDIYYSYEMVEGGSSTNAFTRDYLSADMKALVLSPIFS